MRKLVRFLLVCAITLVTTESWRTTFAQDRTTFCNSVQNRDGFIRYPLGTIGIWSTSMGDMASVMTRAPRIYPCLDSVVVRPLSKQWRFVEDDWRDSITGDPSMMLVRYKPDKPSGPTRFAMTVSKHVAVFKATFPKGKHKKYLVFDFGKPKVDPWAVLNKWKQRVLTRVNDSTIVATISKPGESGAYYVITFSAPCIASGTIQDTSGIVDPGAKKIEGPEVGMYAEFSEPTVTVAVAESFTSMEKAKEFLASEYTGFDRVHASCRAAWNKVLSRVDMTGPENDMRMAYTALYSMYANIVDGTDGSVYLKYYPHPRDLSSSDYWQFIGGFQSCYWDNYRTAYPFLMLGYPKVSADFVGMALARYERDGFIGGNICLFTGPMEGNSNVRVSPVVIAQAYESGIPADYSKLYAALKDNFGNGEYLPESIEKLGYVTQPTSGGKACSSTLEYATSLHSMALLAKANHDSQSASKYLRLSKIYANLWDSTNLAFRVKNTDGTWGPVDFKDWTWNPNPQGLFEGTTEDWEFAVPHDPYGLINLPGQKDFVERVVNYCLNDTWFNDYQYQYPYLLYYAGAADQAQKIVRSVWVPLFSDGVMYEGVTPKPPYHDFNSHYTSNSGWLICSMIGLYPMFAPEGQYIITSPSLGKTVIHRGAKDIVVEAKNNTGKNIYIQSIKVDGTLYPCYMIPAKRLTKGAKIDLEMGSDSTHGLGKLYVSSTNGFVRDAEMVSPSELRCTIDAAVLNATTKVYSSTKPVKILVNGKENDTWNYDKTKKIVTIQTSTTADIEIVTK